MSGANAGNLVIGIAVLALLIGMQVTTRRLRESYRLSIILAVVGVVQFVSFLRGHPHDDGSIVAAVVGSLVIAAVLGAVRALTVRVWREGGQLLRKGTWLTALLWVVALAAHLGYDYLVAGSTSANGKTGTDVGNATILLYLTVSLTVQRFVLLTRVARQEAAGEPMGDPDSRIPAKLLTCQVGLALCSGFPGPGVSHLCALRGQCFPCSSPPSPPYTRPGIPGRHKPGSWVVFSDIRCEVPAILGQPAPAAAARHGHIRRKGGHPGRIPPCRPLAGHGDEENRAPGPRPSPYATADGRTA